MSISPVSIRRLAWISLVFVHLVIIAGSVVRMTGSGMGCPDWPRCFGYTIPPTSTEQVTFTPGRSYTRGQMIVHPWEGQDRLLVAQSDLTADEALDTAQWEVYTKHDYSIFNVTHTWIEFINRLIGALTGLPVLLLVVFSFIFALRQRVWLYFLLSAATLFMLGFEAWLGKLVVDGNLIPGSITIHMMGAVVLVLLLLSVIRLRRDDRVAVPRWGGLILLAAFAVGLLQIVLGTQVREEIDYFVKAGVLERSTWVENLSGTFVVHRTFSWLVLLLNAGWVLSFYRAGVRLRGMTLTIALVLFQFLGGVILVYADMPAAMQPMHLFAGILMLGVLWYVVLQSKFQRQV
jgi:cytochrome c oxidase assembly protein subunit 15